MATASPTEEDQNLETFSLIWLDASVNDSQENVDAQHQLRTSINHLKTFEDPGPCQKYIRSVPKEDRIVFIVSGKWGRQIVPLIDQLPQISSIYVYCMDKETNEKWAQKFTKLSGDGINRYTTLQVKCVLVQLGELINRIRSDQTRQRQNKVDESFALNILHSTVAGEGQSTNELNGQLLHSQLLIDCLVRMKSILTDKNEFITLCKQQYKGNDDELKILQEFERDYLPNRALWWYTRQSFLYRLLNKALRVQNVDLLFLMRFFIRDIGRELERNKCSSPIRVYRGQLMSKEEIQMLKNSVGELISTNSFLSTSFNRQLALSFLLESTDDLERVLFEIDADPRLDNVKPFSNITSYSYFPNEEEVLFMWGSIFRLVNIRHSNDGVWIIQVTLCTDNDHQLKVIFEHMKNEYGCEETNILSLGHVLRKMGKFNHAEKYYRRLLNELNRPPHNNENIAACYHALGLVAQEKGDYKSSLDWYNKSLEIKMQTLKSYHPNIANSYNSLANVYEKNGDYKRALESYNKALVIWKQAYGEDHLRIAGCLHNMAIIYGKENRYLEALDFQQKALVIRQKHLPVDHPHLGQTHTCIGNVYLHCGHHDLALKHLNLALKIYKNSLPPQHPHMAMTLENIGVAYETKGELQEAFSYFNKAATIYRHTLATTHPDRVRIEQNIQRVSSSLK